jgi:hypothetical protein
MALKKPTAAPAASTPTPTPAAAAASAATGKFEDTVVAEKPVQPADEAKAAAAATTAVARAQKGSLAVQQKLETLFAAHENALPPVDFGVLPRIVGSNGSLFDKSNNRVLGQEGVIQLISWNQQFTISPGTDNDADKEHVRYSRDGVTIDETGESVSKYIEVLKTAHGFDDASSKEYCELIGILESVKKNGQEVQDELVGQMVQVSLSPQSRKAFEGYRLQQSVKIRLGKAEASERLKLSAEVKTFGTNSFTLLKTGDAPAQS